MLLIHSLRWERVVARPLWKLKRSQAKTSQDEANALVEAEENKKPTGSVRKESTQRGFNFDGRDGDGDGGVFQFVDSHTASNDFKNNVDK